MNQKKEIELWSQLNNQAWEKLENGDHQNALKDILRSIELLPTFNNHDTAALIYLNLENYIDALHHANKAVHLTQTAINQINRARALVDLGQTEEELENLIKTIKSEGNDGINKAFKALAEHYITRAKILIKLNRLHDAEEDIITAVELGADKKALQLIPNKDHSESNDTESISTDSIANPKDSRVTRYPNGNIATITELNSSRHPHGKHTEYHPNGKIKTSSLRKNGRQMEGTVVTYDTRGNIIRTADINHLVNYHGEVINYWPNGNVRESLAYENDSLIGQICNYDYFGNKICCTDAEKILHTGIDARNKSNYYISRKQYHKDIVFKRFLEELGGDFQYERLSTEYSIKKQYDSTEEAAEVIKNFNKKFDFNRVPGESEVYRKGDYEIVIVENIIILAYLPFFHVDEAKWGVNEYSDEFVELTWIQGIGIVYKLSDLFKYSDVQDEIKWNVPYHTFHDNGIENITIPCKSDAIAEYLADQVILANGGFEYFKKIDKELWNNTEYVFRGPLFVIFINGSNIVINRIKSQMTHISDTNVIDGISELSDAINKSIPGLNRLIYNEGEGHVKDGRFWINSSGTMISSFLPDYNEACRLYLNMLEKHDPKNRDLELPIEEMANSKSKVFEIKTDRYWISLSQGVDVKHINIMLFDDKFKANINSSTVLTSNLLENNNTENKDDKEDIEEPEVKERTHLDHMIFCSGYFTMRTKDGQVYEVQAQKHHLREFYQAWDPETGEWEYLGDEEYLDEFYLTENEGGFRFDDEDVEKYFGKIHDYDWNGLSNDWCGIDSVTPEPVELSQEKWENYKSRFPKITSKEQFNWERSELQHFIQVYSNKSLRSIIQTVNLKEKDIQSLDIKINYRNFITYEVDVYNVGLDFKGYKYEVQGILEEEYGDIDVNYSYNNLDEFLDEISNHEISSVQGHIKNHSYLGVQTDWTFIKVNWLQETPESIKEEFRQEYSKDNYKDLEWEGERDYRDLSRFWRKNNNIRSILISIVHGDTTYQIDWRNTLKNAISKEALKLLTTEQINMNADTDTWYEMDKEEFRAHIRKLKQD